MHTQLQMSNRQFSPRELSKAWSLILQPEIMGITLLFYFNISYFDFSHRSLVSYSDGCGGQNKNQTIISWYLELQRMGVYEILNHKFLVRGHTFLNNDRNFAQIEKRKNSAKVVLPDDWVKVLRDTNLRKAHQVNNIQCSFCII